MLRYTLNIILLLFLLAATVSGCKNQNENKDHSEMDGLYCVNTQSGIFYIQVDIDKSNGSTSYSAYCFTDNGVTCDSIPVTFEGDYLVSTENKKKIAFFKIIDDNIFVTFPTSDLSEKEYPLLKVETLWKNVTIDTNTSLRYLTPIPNSQVALQEDIIYDIKNGFYAELSTEDITPTDYAGYIKKVAETFENTTLKKGVVPLDLKLDIYHPQNDTITKRPLIVMAHGGAFLFGNKQSPLMTKLANDFAERGYVVASINYRLGTTLLGLAAIERTIYRAVQDYRSATRFLIDNSNQYGIDTTSVFYIGHSAGAVTALTAATMDNSEVFKSIDANFFREDLGNIPFKTQTKGVVGLWGGITDLELINQSDSVNMLLFHGTDDDVIPYYSGVPFKCVTGDKIHRIGSYFAKIYGSRAIEERMKEENLPCKLLTFRDMKHDLHLNPDGGFNENMQIVLDTTINYLYKRLTEVKPRIIEHKTGKNSATNTLDRSKLSFVGKVKWDIIGGAIVSQSNTGEIEVCWFTNAPHQSLTATVKTESGIILKNSMDFTSILN